MKMKRSLLFVVNCTLLMVTTVAQTGEMRKWTSSGSGYSLQAEFVKLDGDTVVLKTKNGQDAKVPLDKLSSVDQGYVRQQTQKTTESASPFTVSGDAASKPKDTVSVVVTGVGKDADAALKNAYRAAVEQAVGTLVDTETLVQNEDVVSDKILSFSAGFVQNYKQLGEPKAIDGGLVSMKISAEVKRNDLNDALRKAKIIQVSVDGKNLAAEAITRTTSREDGLAMLKKKLESFPENLLSTSLVGKPRYDVEAKKVVLDVKTTLDIKKFRVFTKEFTDLLLKLDGKKVATKVVWKVERDNAFGNGHWEMYTRENIGESFIRVAITWPNLPQNGMYYGTVYADAYAVPKDVLEMLQPIMFKPQKRLVVEVLDSDGVEVTIGEKQVPNVVYKQHHILCPALFTGSNTDYHDFGGTPECTQRILLDIPVDALGKIKTVKFSYDNRASHW